ncbi:MAG TPA: chromate resistance protein ChrB domain-containing protein [Terriglobales bacterium]|jgi:hypothetical protein|nr:chromate resistance protein ChrB domain-containing protein [Terriglobales bacterium]
MSVTKQSEPKPPWLLLVFSLAKKGASLRVTVWRKLQRYGALPLGNSGYFLPNSEANRERFEWLATAVRTEGGEASVLEVQSIDNCSFAQMKQRFSDARAEDYRQLLKTLRNSASTNQSSRITRLRRRFQDIVTIDFFGSPLRKQVEHALNSVQIPKEKSGLPQIGNVSLADYRSRVWITRPRPGVDRVTSAWLIRKFVDPKARFAFPPEDKKPANAVPFDMYEGGFGHRGEDCTFETLLKVFHIRDKKVLAMAEAVHDADLFDEKFGRKEGFGIDEVMKGWAREGLSDQELLKRGMQLAEGLYKSLG